MTELTYSTVRGMFAETQNVLHRQYEHATEKIGAVAKSTTKEAIALSSAAAAVAMAGRSTRDAEIAKHYNSGLKYGLAGSNGGILSNYIRHTLNNHEILSLFFADKRNPYNKTRRLFVIFSKISLSLLLSAAFSSLEHNRYGSTSISTPFSIQFGDSFIISLILCPYGYILDKIASCSICTRANCCVRVFTSLGYCTLMIIALISILFMIGGIFIAVYLLDTNVFLHVFVISVLLDYASYFYYGIWNWYFLSWEGFLFIPIFPLCRKEGIPGRFMPLFAFWPIKKFLQMWGLCKSTYTEDKAEFIEKYPGRVAIDGSDGGAPAGEESGYDDQEDSHSSQIKQSLLV